MGKLIQIRPKYPRKTDPRFILIEKQNVSTLMFNQYFNVFCPKIKDQNMLFKMIFVLRSYVLLRYGSLVSIFPHLTVLMASQPFLEILSITTHFKKVQ